MDLGGNVIAKRLENVRNKLQSRGMEALLVAKRENCIYLSGFTGSSAELIITKEDAILITDFRYVEQASMQAPMYRTVQYNGKIVNTINDILKKQGIRNIGFEESYLTVQKYEEYKSVMGIVEFLPAGNMIECLRMFKSIEETEVIKKAVRIADDAFSHILGHIKPGIREIEIAAELEYHMKKHGAKGTSFETIVASGKRSAMPHGVASDKVLQLGDAITMDYGCIYEDYCSDMTRTVFLGNPDNDMKKIYGIVLKAQLSALEGAKAGLKGSEIDEIARRIITDNGYDKNFGHGLGHGVGLEVHEEPRLSPTGNVVMENGMVVTVEPGIYIQNYGGVRIEDMIIIDSDSPQILTGSKKDMIII